MNAHGQVVGQARTRYGADRPFRTGPNQPINPVTDDLGVLASSPAMPGKRRIRWLGQPTCDQ